MSTNLAEVLDEFEEQEYKEDLPAVLTDEDAEKLMQKIAWVSSRKAEKQAQYDDQIDFLNRKKTIADEWLQKEFESLDGYRISLESQLRPYIESKLKGKKSRSVKFINGKAGLRKGSEKYYINGEELKNDNQDLVKFVKSYDKDLVKVTETAKWAEFKKQLTITETGSAVTKDGEVVPGLKAVLGEDKFYLEV